MRAIQISEFGGPEQLMLVDVPEPEPMEGHVLVRVDRAGINFADTHQVDNSYLSEATLPLIPGGEVVGRAADGRRLLGFSTTGGYAEVARIPESLGFDVPEELSDAAALAVLVQGVTAWNLLRMSARMQKGDTVVIHAAAGGVGSLAVQLARKWGAGRVIATASSEEKRLLVLSLGAHVAIDASPENLRDRLVEANRGSEVDVVLEMTGGRTFDESLHALAPFGRIVSYGLASRQPPQPIEVRALMSTSCAVVGFWLSRCLAHRQTMIADPLRELVALVVSHELRVIVGDEYPMSLARKAHEDLLARRTLGKLVLDPRF